MQEEKKSVLGTGNEIPLEVFFEEYFNCRRNKRNTDSQLEFEQDYYKYLTQLYYDINNFEYEISLSICFLVYYPKLREVFAAAFIDRIVHHIIIRDIGGLIESKFIDDSYNCRVGKGVYYGVHRLQQQMYEASEGYTKKVYVVKCDLKSFFMSINKSLLWQKLHKLITEEYNGADKEVLLYLVEKVVKHHPERHCELHGDQSGRKYLASDKSLFTCGEDEGLPIGNLTSQIFANFFMAEFDIMMKMRYTFYGRYVDDFFVICKTIEEAKAVVAFCREWLQANLHLTLSETKIYRQPVYNGVKFTGSVVKKERIYVGNKTVQRFKEKIDEINRNYLLTADDIDKYVNSYLGFMSQGRSYNIRRDVIATLRADLIGNLEISSNALKVTSPVTRERRRIKRESERMARKRRHYYRRKLLKRKQYETGQNQSKTLDCRRRQSIPVAH